jgi:hypothetical protein
VQLLSAQLEAKLDLPGIDGIQTAVVQAAVPCTSPRRVGATHAGGGRRSRRTPPWSPTADIHHVSGVRKRRREEGLFWGPCARPTAKWPV